MIDVNNIELDGIENDDEVNEGKKQASGKVEGNKLAVPTTDAHGQDGSSYYSYGSES